MKVLVTGGAGYVGSTLVPLLLSRGHSVRVLDNLMHGGQSLLPVWSNPAFEFHRGDILNADSVRAAVDSMEAVVHLAAIVGDPACAREPERARAVNLDGPRALIEQSKRAGVSRFVFASTCSNYGKMKDPNAFVTESSDLTPVSLYAQTKVQVEKDLLAAEGLCATPLRFATVFGVSPRMRFDLTVNEFTMEMIAKKRLTVFGEQFWRPYIHARDAARGIATVLEAPEEAVRSTVFNVGDTNQNYQKATLVELIRPHAPDARVEFVQRQEDPRDYRVSFALFTERFGFSITRTVSDGIAEVAQLVKDGIIQGFDQPEYRN